jgi:hypothetical protein
MSGINFHFFALLYLCCGYAWWRGGTPERVSAAVFVAAVHLTLYVGATGATRWTSIETSIFVVDVVALTAWTAVALTAERFWPIWFTALHVIAVAGHAVKLADPDLVPWAYNFAIAFPSYPMLVILAAAAWNHRRRSARGGRVLDWTCDAAPGGTTGLSLRRRSGPPLG